MVSCRRFGCYKTVSFPGEYCTSCHSIIFGTTRKGSYSMYRTKCKMSGCPNYSDQGQFLGEYCLPCHNQRNTVHEMDGYKVELGDRVWSCTYGGGKVHELNNSKGSHFTVLFDNSILRSYTSNGQRGSDQLRTLFWGEIKFDIPHKKEKVTRWRWVAKTKHESYFTPSGYYAHQAEFARTNTVAAENGVVLVQKIEESAKDFWE